MRVLPTPSLLPKNNNNFVYRTDKDYRILLFLSICPIISVEMSHFLTSQYSNKKVFHFFICFAKKMPFLNPTPALPVKEEEAKRRWRTTPRYRSVTISPEKTLPIPKKIYLCILSILSPSSYFSLCAEACDLYDGGQFNGNCLQI